MRTTAIAFLVAVFLAGCGGRGQDPLATPVLMEPGNTFGPQTVTVPPGADLQWTNTDSIAHTVTSDVAGSGPDSAATFPNGVGSGQNFRWRVPGNAVSGTMYFYHCAFHGTAGNGSQLGQGMVGVIVVD